MTRRRILFTTPLLHHPPTGGPVLRIENSIKALHRIAELHVVSRVSLPYLGGAEGEAFYRAHSSAFSYAPSVAGIADNRWIRGAQRLLRGRKAVGRDAAHLVAYMRKHAIDVLWAGYGNISFDVIARVKELAPEVSVVCDTDSVWSRFVLRRIPYEPSAAKRQILEAEGRRKEEEERAWVNLCEVTTAVSEVDARYYRELAREPQRVMPFSNVIDVDSYRDVPPPPPGHRTPNVYLAGTFGNDGPMDHAARWLAGSVLPLVLREIPGMHLYLVGIDGDVSLRDLAGPGVTITGKVPSVLPYLRHASVALVPLFFESGTRFKILEAGACGVPIVSTTLGAEGLPLQDGEQILITDEPEAFAAAIVRLVRDREFAMAMAAAGRAFVEEHCGIRQLIREAEAILARLDQGQQRRMAAKPSKNDSTPAT